MKFTRFIMSLACIVFASYGAFARDELIPFVLTDGKYIGSPSSFVLNKTKKVFCTDTQCTATITRLNKLPSSSKGFYTGSAIDGTFPLIDKNGYLLMSNDLLQYGLVTGQEYKARNLFWNGDSITFFFKESLPTSIYLNSWADGWINGETRDPITKMTALPKREGKIFVGFGTSSDPRSFRVIDRDGNILSQAAGMYGRIGMSPIWKSTVMCEGGYYLPAYKESCALCPENYWCPGGRVETNYFEDQGINACRFGLISKPRTAYSADCYTPGTDMRVCDPGWYLPEKAKSCYKCPNGSWCPGGIYYLKISDAGDVQGINKCPSGGASAEQSTDISQCFIEKLPIIIENGTASQTCYYGVIGYTESCFNYKIECYAGYHIDYSKFPVLSCALNDGCKIDPNALESDENCIPTKCNADYHIEDNQCVSNIATCPIENGIGRKEWMGDNRLNGKWTMCTAYKCNPGYTSERYLTNETDKPCGECKNRRDASGNIAVSAWKEYNCEIATCMYQGELYRLDSTGNKCVQICDTAGREDVTGTMLWNPLTEKCERTCNSGFTSW